MSIFSAANPIKNLRLYYWISLLIILSVIVGSQWLIYFFTEHQKEDGVVINLSGRQRMLSQKITKLTLLISQADSNGSVAYRTELKESIYMLDKIHKGLQTGDDSLGLPVMGDERDVRDIFAKIIPLHHQFIENALTIANSDITTGAFKNAFRQLLAEEREYLDWLDKLTRNFSDKLNEKVKRIQSISLGARILLVAILLFEIGIIFLPMLKRAENSLKHISEFNEELQAMNTGLEESRKKYQFLSELFSSVLENSLSGIVVFRSVWENGIIADFEWLFINEKAGQLSGRTPELLVGKRLLEEMPGVKTNMLFEKFVAVAETGIALDIEHYYSHENISLWMHLVAVKLEDGFILTFSNITDRKINEEIIQENQANLTSLIENTQDIIWSVDTSYSIKTLNNNFKNLIALHNGRQLKPGDKSDLSVLPNELAAHWLSFYERAIKGESFTSEFSLTIQGQLTHFEFNFNPIIDNKNKIIGITIFGRDISWRIKAEKEIRDKSQITAGILRNMPVIISRINKEGIITESSGDGLARLGLPQNATTGRNIFDLYPENAEHHELMFSNNEYHFTTSTIYGTDKRYWDMYSFHDQVNKGDIIVFAIDITERYLAEQAIKMYNSELEKINENKDKLFSIIAHDLRNPLMGMMGSSELLVKYMENLTTEDIQTFAQNIYTSAVNLSRLLNNLLDWANLQRSGTKFRPEHTDLVSLIEDALLLSKVSADQKEIRLITDIPNRLFAWIDSYMIYSVLRNLLFNAIKFTRKGGEIEVEVEEKDKEIEIRVKDNGVGMSVEQTDNIFRDAVSSQGTDKERGTGLGLMMSKEFIEKHGGKIWVASKLNEGSCFYFSIPVRETAQFLNLS